MTIGSQRGNHDLESGLWAMLSMAALHGIAADQAKLIHEFGVRFNSEKILLAAQSLGMTAKTIRQDSSRLTKAPLPIKKLPVTLPVAFK